MINVLIADDHAIFRAGLRRVLALADGMTVASEARNGHETLELAQRGKHDILLLDLNMPGPCGVELIKRVCDEAPGLPILVLTVHDEVEIARRAIAAGAAGYLTKDSEPETLFDAVRMVSRGKHYVNQALASQMLFQPADGDDAPHRRLSDREFDVFLRLAAGEPIAAIAAALRISPKTVSTHKFRLLQKLGLDTDRELIRYALRHALVK